MRQAERDGAAGRGPMLEELEGRMLLNAAPTLATALLDRYFLSGPALTLGIDGYDADGDALTITAVSGNAKLHTYVPQGNRYAKLHYVDHTGAPIGDILVQLFDDRTPTATARFVTLATNKVNANKTLDPNGTPFYTHVPVHRILDGFMQQMGDPVKGDGTGGSPLGKFNDSFDPYLAFSGPGALAMANSGANTNDSQFFLTDEATPWLNFKHMIFGQLISGWAVHERIMSTPTTVTTTDGVKDNTGKPINKPYLESVQIVQSPQDATVTLRADPGFSGEAQVTVSLDDGHGHVTTRTITVTVRQGTVILAPGQTLQFRYGANHPVAHTLNIAASYAGAQPTIDSTGLVTIRVPQGFSGMFTVNLSGVKTGRDTAIVSGVSHTMQIATGDAMPQRAEIPTYGGGSPISMIQSGNWLFVAAGQGGVQVYDVTNPASPTLRKAYYGVSYARDVKLVGTTLVVLDDYKGIVCLDASAPQSLAPMGLVATKGFGVAMAVRGSTVFVADWTQGLTAVDVSNPNSPKVVGNVKALPTVGYTMKNVIDVAVKDRYVYASDAAGVVIVFDALAPANMRFVTGFVGKGILRGLAVEGSRLYLADEGAGLVVYDISNPAKPKRRGEVALGGAKPYQLAASRNHVAVSTDHGFVFVDANDPKHPAVEYVHASAAAGQRPAVLGSWFALPLDDANAAMLDGEVLLDRIHVRSKSSFRDAAGRLVTVSITGGGRVRIATTGTGSGNVELLEVLGPTTATSVKITTSGGPTALPEVIAYGAMKSFTAKTCVLAGNMTVQGGVGTLTLGNVTGDGRTIALGQTAALGSTKIILGAVEDLHLESNAPISSLTAASWFDVDGSSGTLEAPAVTKLTVKGDFGADVDLDGSLGKASISGWLDGSAVRTGGGITSLTVGGMRNTSIVAGSVTTADADSDGVIDLPELSAFAASGRATIGKLKVSGKRRGGFAVVNSTVAAWTINSIGLAYANTAADAIFGVASGSVGTLTYQDAQTKLSYKAGRALPEPIGHLVFRLA